MPDNTNQRTGNIFAALPDGAGQEVFETLLRDEHVRIERIISRGHVSPSEGEGWYDQEQSEWVIVLQGAGRILFENGTALQLGPGDYLMIPPHTKHRVTWTDPTGPTLWLAVHWDQSVRS